jgi:hypothetical protein
MTGQRTKTFVGLNLCLLFRAELLEDRSRELLIATRRAFPDVSQIESYSLHSDLRKKRQNPLAPMTQQVVTISRWTTVSIIPAAPPPSS